MSTRGASPRHRQQRLLLCTLSSVLPLLLLCPSRVSAWCRGSDPFCNDSNPNRYTCGSNYDCKMRPGGGLSTDESDSGGGSGWECTCQLKGGIIAAIVISCVAFAMGVCALLLIWRKREQKRKQAASDAAALALLAERPPMHAAAAPPVAVGQPLYNPSGNGVPFQYAYPAALAHLQPQGMRPQAGGGLMIAPPPLYVQPAGSAAAAGGAVRFCSSCGAALAAWTGANLFCAGCGARRPEAGPPPPQPPLPQQPLQREGMHSDTAEGQPPSAPPPIASYSQPQFAAAPGGAPIGGQQYEGQPQYGLSYGISH